MSKLFGFCGCIHGASGRFSNVAVCYSLWQCVVTMSMLPCVPVWIVLVIGFLNVVTRE
jgi:hypothetical protein